MTYEAVRYRVSSPRVIHEIMEGEVVLINLDTGTYYSLDKAGEHIWRGIEAVAPVGAIADDLARRYDATREHIGAVITQLLDALRAEGLVTEAQAAEAPETAYDADVPVNGSRPRLEFCTLQRFADMEELLVLDPIHEVDEAGWPLKK